MNDLQETSTQDIGTAVTSEQFLQKIYEGCCLQLGRVLLDA